MLLSMQLLEVNCAMCASIKDSLVVIVTSLVIFVIIVLIVILIILIVIFIFILLFFYCLIWLHLLLLRLCRWMICCSATRHLSRLCSLLGLFLLFIGRK